METYAVLRGWNDLPKHSDVTVVLSSQYTQTANKHVAPSETKYIVMYDPHHDDLHLYLSTRPRDKLCTSSVVIPHDVTDDQWAYYMMI